MTQQTTVAPHSAGWRFNVGIMVIGLTLVLVLLIPLSAAMGMPASTVATITGVVFIGNKVLLLIAIGVMGKAGFRELKQRVFRRLTPETLVGPTRHRIGLVMFCVPLLLPMLSPYLDYFWPGLRPNSFPLQVFGNVLLIASFFVLGGNFWDKVRALFVRTTTVVDTPPAQ